MTFAAGGNARLALPKVRHLSLKSQGELIRTKIFSFIVGYKLDHDGNSPSTREIGEAVGIASTAWVSYHLDVLERQGKILRPHDYSSRMIEVVGGRWVFEDKGNATAGVLPRDPKRDHG